MNDMQPTVLILDEPTTRAVDALTDYFVQLNRRGIDAYPFAAPHIIARASLITAPAAADAWRLGGMILARAAGDAAAPGDEALAGTAARLREDIAVALDVFDDTLRMPAPFGKRAEREARARAADSAGTMLHEIALEERCVNAVLGVQPDGKEIVLARPLEPAAAFAQLFEPLLDFLDLRAEDTELVAMERNASAWWFDTWSAPSKGNAETFAHEHREREFSLFDRDMVSLDESLASAVARHPSAESLPARQRALLDGVLTSVPSLFVVRERHGADVVVEDLDTRRRFAFREHNDELEYAERYIMAGRLIPIADLGWLRSPGALLWKSAREGDEGFLGNAVRKASSALPRAVAVEALISTIARGARVPRVVRPAPSRREAKELLFELNVAMAEAGLSRETDASELPAEMRDAAGAPGQKVLTMPVDAALSDWVQALGEQAGIGPLSGGGAPGERRLARAERAARPSGGGSGDQQ